MVVSQDPEWLQGSLNVLIVLFRRYKLVANVAKSKVMTCHPVTLYYGMFEEAVGPCCMGRGAAYRNRSRRRIPFPA